MTSTNARRNWKGSREKGSELPLRKRMMSEAQSLIPIQSAGSPPWRSSVNIRRAKK